MEVPNVPIRPVQDYILVKPLDPPDKSVGGIVLVAAVSDNVEGLVVRVGPGRVNSNGVLVKTECEPGVKVLYNKHVGTEIEHDGKKYRLFREDAVLAVLA